jgi:predicted nucleic acid-binding protein
LSAVADSSVLIWLARIGRLSLLREEYESIIVPSEVYLEVVEEGLREGHRDAHVIKEAIQQGWIKVEENESVTSDAAMLVKDMRDLHEGEAAALLMARRRGLPLLMDESSGRAIAKTYGIIARGVLHVLLKGIWDGKLSEKDARDDIALLTVSKFRIDPKLLARVIREITGKGNQ